MFANHFVEGGHQPESLLNVRQGTVPKDVLIEEREGACAWGWFKTPEPIRSLLRPRRATSQGVGDGREQQQAVAPVAGADVRRQQAHSEVDVFLVPKRFFDAVGMRDEKLSIDDLAAVQLALLRDFLNLLDWSDRV
jgi:hypothetical protein